MCTLRASGAGFDPYAFLAGSSLVACRIFRPGEPHAPRSRPSRQAGIAVGVSDASWSDLDAQVADAERFLERNRAEIERLARTPGIGITLDFPLTLQVEDESEPRAGRFIRFPASLVRLAAELGIELELSLYPLHDEE
jgi:hypothetical protein